MTKITEVSIKKNTEPVPKFKIGDHVEVIKYGSLLFSMKELNLPIYKEFGGIYSYDTSPELVGMKGVVNEVSITQRQVKYSLSGIKGKTAWYDEDQLKFFLQRISFPSVTL